MYTGNWNEKLNWLPPVGLDYTDKELDQLTGEFSPEIKDDFALTMDSIMAEIEAADPSDLREMEPSEDWDDGACTEPPEEDGDYIEEDDGL